MVQNTGPQAAAGGGDKAGLKDTLTNEDNGQKESVVCLTSQQLQQVLNAVQHSAEDHRAQGSHGDGWVGMSGSWNKMFFSLWEDQTGSKSISGNEGGEMKQEVRGGDGVKKDQNGSSEEKDSRWGALMIILC